MLEITRIPVLKDNYVWLLCGAAAAVVAVVDPAVEEPVVAELDRAGLRLTHILNTHHHNDHVGANLALKARYGCMIVGPRADRNRIPGIDLALAEDDTFTLGGATARVFDVPGHTRGHIAFWFAGEKALFCGDTLFALGCGRLFEGTPDQMWASLLKFRVLPDDTRVFCAHEYTQSNARFALTADPGNAALAARAAEIDALRAKGTATVPSLLGVEKATNPFLRADHPALAATYGLKDRDPVAVFAAIRSAKDRF